MSDAILVAGTRTYFEIAGSATGYLEIEGVRSLGAIGATGSYVEQTTLKDRTRRYIGGLKDTAESTLRLAVYPGDANQDKFIQAAQNTQNCKMKVVMPPNASGKQFVAVFDVALSGYQLPEMSGGNTIIEYEISYRLSGEPAFSFADQGKVYSISDLTVTTGGSITVGDGDYQLEQGKDFTTSGDGVGATVTVTIASNTINAIKSIDHGGLGYSVSDTLSVTRVGGVNATTNGTLTVSTVS
ncbi:major tail protein [Vibrio phage K394]